MPGPTVTTKTKAQLQVELYTVVIKPVVVEHIEIVKASTWKIVSIVQQAVYQDGFTEELIREHFRKALHETIPDPKSGEFKSYQAVINRAIRIALAFSTKELERKRKDKSFTQICADLAIAKEVRQSLPTDKENGDRDAPYKQEAEPEPEPEASPIKKATVKTKAKPAVTSWTAPQARSKASSQDSDDWREESLAIISSQFSRFIAMVKEAMDSGELTDAKLTELHELLIN
jgi:hypothetical protein